MGFPLHPSVTQEKTPSMLPSTLLLSPTSTSSPRTTGPTISLLVSKSIIRRCGDIKSIPQKEVSEKPVKYLSETSNYTDFKKDYNDFPRSN
jgi:hypothetical protein